MRLLLADADGSVGVIFLLAPVPEPPLKRIALSGMEPDFPAQHLRVAANGEDLGEMTLAEVRRALMERRIGLDDFYLSDDGGEWLLLSGHPLL